jgi:hypothetical protein
MMKSGGDLPPRWIDYLEAESIDDLNLERYLYVMKAISDPILPVAIDIK